MKRRLMVWLLVLVTVIGTTGTGYPAESPSGWSVVGDLGALDPTPGRGPGDVDALVMLDNTLYAGTEGGVWRWNGFTWSEMIGSGGIHGHIVAGFDGRLYTVGNDNNVYCWRGSDWSKAGDFWTPTNGKPPIDTLAGDKDLLYAGTDDGVWAWDGSAWFPLGNAHGFSGPAARVHDLYAANGVLYAGTDSGVWSWNGSTWSQLGGSPESFVDTAAVLSLVVTGRTLYAGTYGRGVWSWDGSQWSPVGGGAGSPVDETTVLSLVTVNAAVYAGTTDGVWSWDGSGWSPVGNLTISGNPAVAGSLLWANGTLYAGTGGGGAWSVPPVSRSAGVKFTIGQTSYVVGDRSNTMDAAPFVSHGRTLVPIRYLAGALGAHTTWDDATRTVIITRGPALHLEMVVGSRTINVNGRLSQMDVSPAIVDGRTYLPARYVAEPLGYTVEWDAGTQTVNIGSAP